MIAQQDSVLITIIKARRQNQHRGGMNHLAKTMFDMHHTGGFPPDMFMDEIEKRQPLTLLEKVYLVAVYQDLLMDHKRASNAGEKALERTRKNNLETITMLIKTGETGIY